MDLNFLRNLRLRNLFDSMGQNNDPGFSRPNPMPNMDPGFNMPNPGVNNDPGFTMDPQTPAQQPNAGLYNVAQRMSELYHPETSATDRFNRMVDNFPQEAPVSKKRKLGAIGLAALSDITGNNQGKGIFDEVTGKNDYTKKVGEWKTKIAPVEQAANTERANNSNERMFANQVVTGEQRQSAADAKAKIDKQKADLADFKARNPNMKFDVTGPKVKIMDPATGKVTVTDIDTGNLTDTEKLNLQQKNDLEKIDAQGKNSANVATIQGQNSQAVADTRGWKIGTIPDPNDPSKQIGVRYNEATGEVQPIKVNGQNTTVTAGNGKPPVDTQQAVKQKAQETLDALDEILDSKTGKLKDSMLTAIGASRMAGLQFLPGSQTRSADAAIKRLKNMLTIELLGEMKAQSRTGATGFGQLSVKELNVLESAASKLDPTLDEETFTAELKRIQEKLKKIMQPSSGLESTTTIKKPTAAEMIAKYGGKGGVQ